MSASKQGRRRIECVHVATLALLVVSSVPAQAAIHTPSAVPPFLIGGTATPVTITTYIPDATLIPTSVNVYQVDMNGRVIVQLGVMNDNGNQGDATPSDRIYTYRTTVTEGVASAIRIRITAAFRGVLLRPNVEILIPIVTIPVIRTAADYSGAIDSIFDAALSVRAAVTSLISTGTPLSAVDSTLNGLTTSAINFAANLSAVITFENQQTQLVRVTSPSSPGRRYAWQAIVAAERGALAFPTSQRLRALRLNPFLMSKAITGQHRSARLGFAAAQTGAIGSVFPGGGTVVNLFDAGAASKSGNAAVDLYKADASDPRVANIAAYCVATNSYDLTDSFERGLCAKKFELDPNIPNSTFNRIKADTQNIAVGQANEVATDLVGNGLGGLFSLGTIAVQAVKGVANKILDFFETATGAKGVFVSQVGNEGLVSVPAGLSTVSATFVDSEPRALLLNATVRPNVQGVFSAVGGTTTNLAGAALPTPNRPPTAGFSMSVQSQIARDGGTLNVAADAATGEARVTFTDTSTDPDGASDIVSRVWTVNTQTGPLSIGDLTFGWGFTPGGPYIVTLIVTDRGGLTSTASGSVVVSSARVTLLPGQAVLIRFRTNPPFTNSFPVIGPPDFLHISWFGVVARGNPTVTYRLFDGTSLLGAVSSPSLPNVGSLPAVFFKSASSRWSSPSIGPDVVVPFTSMLNGTIDGIVEMRIDQGSLELDLEDIRQGRQRGTFFGLFAPISPSGWRSGLDVWYTITSMSTASALPVPVPTGATIFESAVLGSTGWPAGSQGMVISTDQSLGVRFQVNAPVAATAIGGHFRSNRFEGAPTTIYGAVIALSGPLDFPDSVDLSTPDVLGVAPIAISSPSNEFVGSLNVELRPGWYALVFGTGRFGTLTWGAVMPGTVTAEGFIGSDVDVGLPSYFFSQAATKPCPPPAFGNCPTGELFWVDGRGQNNTRMFIKGAVSTFPFGP